MRSAPLFDSAEEPQGSVERLVDSLAASARREGRSLVTAPVLEPGKDPGERDEVPSALCVDTMVIDPRFLPDARLGRPFVFRADEETSRRVRDRVAPGDLVIVSRDLDDGAPVPGRVYAMRKGAAGSSWEGSRATARSSSSSRGPRRARWSTSGLAWGDRRSRLWRGRLWR